MKKLLLTLVFLSFTALNAQDAGVCTINEETKIAPCNVKGGLFSSEEVEQVIHEDAVPGGEIYKNVSDGKIYLYLFYAYDCPHCKKAHEFLNELKKQYPDLVVRQYEIKRNKLNLDFFKTVAKEYGVSLQGVPAFFVGNKSFVGFDKKYSCTPIINEIKRLKGLGTECSALDIDIPMIGKINVGNISLPTFTIYMGFLDGLNPCAMWVLMFLLGLLVYAQDRRKVMFLGTTFVVASGVVYFLFMTAWVNLFLVIGYSKIITVVLGSVAVVMGLVNVKELFFFKKGISLMIPEAAKPKLYKKSRKVVNETNKFLAVIGTIMLAVFVNFIELGCTVGLPAIYTRILSLRNLPPLTTYLYIALYNVVYVLPLAIIVAVFAYTMGHFKFTEKHGKIFKLISGLLMLLLGVLLILYPQVLVLG